MSKKLEVDRSYVSLNFDERPKPGTIDALVLHYTACDFDLSLKTLCDSDSETPVSAHYLIDEGGEIYGLVPEEKRAWHAGASFWQGRDRVNDFSIGIELVNLGDEPFRGPQMESLKALAGELVQKYKISSDRVLGHEDVAPGRKGDPGPYFDWQMLAETGVGFFPTPGSEPPQSLEVAYVQKLLRDYGYGAPTHGRLDPQTRDVIRAFQRRFCPHEATEEIHPPMVCMLEALLTDTKSKK